MKLYIQQIDGVFGKTEFRSDFENLAKDVYNAQGWFDFEPTPSPHSDINVILSNEAYLDTDGVVRYRWTQIEKTGEDLQRAIRDKWSNVRGDRAELLKNSDYTQLADAPFDDQTKTSWATYRQALRDITNQSDPFNLTWPTAPDGRVMQIGVSRV